MPTRLVREGILTSEAINSLSPEAELFYRRLMNVADDYGRYYADARILHTNCFPMRLDSVTEAQIKGWLKECTLTKPYPVLVIYGHGKYLQFIKFGQQTRSDSKFPEPSGNELLSIRKANDKQLLSLVGDEGVGGDVVGDVYALKNRLSKMFARAATARWSYLEESTFADLFRRETFAAELEELEKFKPKPGSFFPQSLGSLLTKWTETLDRAKNYEINRRNNSKSTGRNNGTANEGKSASYDAYKSKPVKKI